MCKTYDAILKIHDKVESDILILWLDNVEIRGSMADCPEEFKKHDAVLTLTDVTVICKECGERKLKKLSIPTCWIKSFCFECCEN